MADTKISALTDGSPLQSTDDIPVARSGTNRRVRIDLSNYATAAQGALADTAVQPGDLATVAITGAYADLSGTPTIPTTALPVSAVSVAASKTLALSDANTEQVVDSGTAVVLTIPTNAAVALAIGTKVSALGIGAGSVTVTADTGVTLNGVSAGSGALTAQYSAVVITKVGADAWVLNGDHGAVA